MAEAGKKFIDIDKIFAEKNPGLYKWIPKFFVNYVKKITRQEQINQFIDHYGHLTGFAFVDAIIHEFKFKYTTVGEENIVRNGPVMFVSNHPLGGLDGISLLQVLSKYRPDVKFVVNDILKQLKNLDELFVGVNKHGRNTKDTLAELEKLFANDTALLIFPAGLVSRKRNGVIADLPWRKTFISKSRKYNKPIVPIHVSGHLTNFFYRLANTRTAFGVKANIEMLYLPDEMYKQEHLNVTITIGKPINASTFNNSKSDDEWAAWVRNEVYALAKK